MVRLVDEAGRVLLVVTRLVEEAGRELVVLLRYHSGHSGS